MNYIISLSTTMIVSYSYYIVIYFIFNSITRDYNYITSLIGDMVFYSFISNDKVFISDGSGKGDYSVVSSVWVFIGIIYQERYLDGLNVRKSV